MSPAEPSHRAPEGTPAVPDARRRPGAGSADPGAGSTAGVVKSILAASSGNLVEWFDFYIYAFFSVYFAPLFFTGTGETGAFAKSAAVFFVGFLMRPIGGYVFGRVADRYGRKTSMLASILLMCAGSLSLAMLPTAETIGAAAPWLLLLVRCVQGLSVGGEYGSTATYMSEVATAGKRGFFSSFQYVTLIGGQLLASLLAVIMTHTLGDDAITAGWWRLPFVIGAAAAVVSLWLRSGLAETTTPEERQRRTTGRFLTILRDYPRAFWVVLGITSIGSLTFYVFTTYMQKYLINTGGFAKGEVADAMTVCLLLYLLMQPAAGRLSDRIGRKTSMLIYVLGMIVLVVPLLTLIGRASSLVTASLLVLVAMLFLSLYTSISGIVKAEMFPAHVRGLGVGFTYAIGNSLFGGSAEYVALFLKEQGLAGVFPWYVVVVGVLGLVAVLFMHDNRSHSTLDHPESSAYGR
ncbi:MFS transporter [Rothia kristinae]|uniref:MFS transporter n=1 Tax=Rothia kristinae TaxID=37923 RepID=UPI0022DFAC44|nr:MFS transporter [Rothia kristinae]